jgi:hypothetical protein
MSTEVSKMRERSRGGDSHERSYWAILSVAGVALLIVAALAVAFGLTACGKEQPQGILVISSDPPRAEVYCNGEIVVGAFTPAKLRLPPGQHLISLRKSKYEEFRQTVHIQENRVLDLKVTMRETKGVALLESDPPNAEVHIKATGVKLGNTPLLITELPLDTVILTLSHDGYDSSDISITLSDRIPYVKKESLKSRLAPIFINSEPEGASVYLDGELLGKTPITRQYLAGNYKVRVQMEGRNTVTDAIEIIARQEFSKTYELVESPVTLEIESIPAGATVFVNGKNQGAAPLKLKDLPAGTYSVRFVMPKHLEVEKEVTIQPGKEGRVEARLEKNVGVIQVQTKPPGVEVRVDGKPIGITKALPGQETSEVMMIPEIEAGERRVEFIKEKFHVVTKSVTVKREEIVLTTPDIIVMEQKDDTLLWLKGSSTPRRGVVLHRNPDGSILFSSSGGSIKNTYQKDEIEREEPIRD